MQARQKRFLKMAVEPLIEEQRPDEIARAPRRDYESELAAINSKLIDSNMARRDSYMMMQSYVGDKFEKEDKKVKKEVRRRTTYKARLALLDEKELEDHLNARLHDST